MFTIALSFCSYCVASVVYGMGTCGLRLQERWWRELHECMNAHINTYCLTSRILAVVPLREHTKVTAKVTALEGEGLRTPR